MDIRTKGSELDIKSALWDSELIVSDTIGRLLSFWGFKKNMGRVWAILFLSNRPLTAKELRGALQVSSGNMSMTLADLTRWGVARKVWIHGDRKDYYVAEGNIWKMISRVLRERERNEIIEAITAFEKALVYLSEREKSEDRELDRLKTQHHRIQQLLDFAGSARKVIDALISAERMDPEWIRRLSWGKKFPWSN